MATNRGWFGNTIQSVKTGAGNTVQSVKTGASNAVSGSITAVGNGVSGTGKGVGGAVNTTTRGWADGLRSYGNAMKDASGATGPRATTATNPLGISGSGTSGLKKSKAYSGAGSTVKKGSASNPLGLN